MRDDKTKLIAPGYVVKKLPFKTAELYLYDNGNKEICLDGNWVLPISEDWWEEEFKNIEEKLNQQSKGE